MLQVMSDDWQQVVKLQVTKTHWSAPRDAVFLRNACKQRFNTHLVQYQFSTGTGNKEQS